eukprot:s1532_g8.t1
MATPLPSALLPSSEVLDGWTNMAEAMQLSGVDEGLSRAVFRQLGDPTLTSMQVLAVLPPETLRQAMHTAKRGTREVTAIEKGQLTLMFCAIRVKFGAQPFSLEDSVSVSASAPPPSSSTGSLNVKVKIKLSQVIDQACDLEVEQMDHKLLLACRQRYVVIEGDAPIEREEVTDAQLTCLHAKISQNMSLLLILAFGAPTVTELLGR